MFVNTQEFRREALHFLKYGYYTNAPEGTQEHKEYWDEQERRCKEGYTIGGVKITGEHYGYLNFAQIKLTADKDENVTKDFKKKAATKRVVFPDFWDSDYNYFWFRQIARHGLSGGDKELAKLELGYKPKFLDGGRHLTVGKARRKGYSYKNGYICNHRYQFEQNSMSLIGAYDKKYLFPEGTMGMATEYINFFNKHTDWYKRTLIDKQDHVKSGYSVQTEKGIWVEKGFRSQIMAISCGDNPGALRGKDATLILFEEAGKWPNLLDTFQATRDTLEDGVYVTGQMIIFGTGGGEDSNWEAFETIFYNPEAYNMLPFENIWDEGAADTFCSFFIPDYLNKPGFIDKDGNSDIAGAKLFEEKERDTIRSSSKNPRDIIARGMEHPFNPKEAFSRAGENIFPIEELEIQLSYLKSRPSFGTPGKLVNEGEGIKFKPDFNQQPIYEFPAATSKSEGCVVIYETPYKIKGKVPDNLYIICHDPFAIDDANYTKSCGAAYVIMNTNNIVPPGEKIVASFVARPRTTDEYNKILFMLAEYYNAKIGFESDRGDVIGYAKRFKKLHWLENEFELAYDEKLKTTNPSKQKYGMKMASGKENLRKLTGDKYIADWLITPRYEDENGKVYSNLHAILDSGMINELIKYKPKGSQFDRVSALRVGMFHLRELIYSNRVATNKKEPRKLFKTKLFQ